MEGGGSLSAVVVSGDAAMPVTWSFGEDVLTVAEVGLVPNPEIERVFIGEALADPRCGTATRVLWDARAAEFALPADEIAWRFETLASLAERGAISRFALVWPADRHETLALLHSEMPKAVQPLQMEIFTRAPEALAWLSAG